jgi:uncharacterized repeat protein (TIGR01451 family)
VNVDRRWLRTSVVRVRVLGAGLVLLATGCAVLGWGFRSGHSAANAAAPLPAIQEQAAIPSLLAAAQNLPGPASSAARSRARSLFDGLPLIFEPNQGQGNLDPADVRAKFVTRGSGYSLFLGSEGAILNLVSQNQVSQNQAKQNQAKHKASRRDSRKPDASLARVESLQMKLAGANQNASVTGADLLPGKSNYFLGNDPAKWRTGVPQFAKVRYDNVYPGINLVFYGHQGRLEYDFQVSPGADPVQAELEFSGAKQLQLKNGSLVIKGESGSMQLDAPRIYQEIAGRQQPVEGRFILRGDKRAGFAVGSYDRTRELVIDPVLTFGTYFGGSGNDGSINGQGGSTSVAVDGSLNIYLTGLTTSPNLPTTTGVFQAALAPGAAQNVYIAKIQPPLSSLPASLLDVTYLGGNGTDYPIGIAVDGGDNVYVAGTTTSSNFPTLSTGYQQTPEVPGTHAFVTELQSSFAALQYSSYLSGNGTDIASGMALDASGYVYVTGTTTSTDASSAIDQFPASNVPQGVPFQNASKAPGLAQFFVTKVNPTSDRTSSIAYSTYFGGGTFDTSTPIATGGGIAVDANDNVYFTGTTNYLYTGTNSSTDFPILDAYQPCLDVASSGTFTNPPTCTNTAPTPTAPDAFVAKLNLNPKAAQGEQLVWSTYVGGENNDSGAEIALDAGAANVYIVGTTNSTKIGFGTVTLNTVGAYQSCLNDPGAVPPNCAAQLATPPSDAFVARLSNPALATTGIPINVALNYFSYLGGGGNDEGLAIAVDAAEGAVVTGWTQSTNFPVAPASNQSSLTGTQAAFMARLNTTAAANQTISGSWANYFDGASTDGSSILTEGTGVAIDVNQNTYFAGDTNSPDLEVEKPLITSAAVNTTNGYAGGFDSFVTQNSAAVSLSITGVLSQGTNQQFISAGNQATFTYTITNNGPDPAYNVTVLDNLSVESTKVPVTLVSASVSSGQCPGAASINTSVSCTLPALQAGSTATVTIVLTPTPSGGVAPFTGGTVEAIGPGNNTLAQTTVSATMSDYSMSVGPPNNSVAQAGDTAVYQVQLSPIPVYASPIGLSCSGQPAGASCNFTTQSVTLAGPGSSTLNLTTTARPVTTPIGSLLTRHFYAIWLAVPGLTLLGVGAGGNRRRRRMLGLFMLCAMFALILLLPACSHTNTQIPVSGTPAGKYTITVTAASGTDSKSQYITLTVP